jgi:hypothetical protein
MIKTHMYTYDYVSECLLRSPCVQGDVGGFEAYSYGYQYILLGVYSVSLKQH